MTNTISNVSYYGAFLQYYWYFLLHINVVKHEIVNSDSSDRHPLET